MINENHLKFKDRLLLSTQKALLGMIYPDIRAVSVGHEGIEKLKIIIYLDREPDEDDFEVVSDVAGEICSDIPFRNVEEVCEFSAEPIPSLDKLASWVYMRKES
mgnify:CR=1 FL=1